MTTTPSPADLAQRFVSELQGTLTAAQWRAMCAANRVETHPGVCHSHDYCDANVCMAAAFAAFGVTVDVDDDAQLALWAAAWEEAMPTLRGETAPGTAALLLKVAQLLEADGFTVTVEHPGCVVVWAEDLVGAPEHYWWFGTANGTWQGDLCGEGGAALGQTLSTGVDGDCREAWTVAAGIRAVLNGGAQ
jgi:hypothetical protein